MTHYCACHSSASVRVLAFSFFLFFLMDFIGDWIVGMLFQSSEFKKQLNEFTGSITYSNGIL